MLPKGHTQNLFQGASALTQALTINIYDSIILSHEVVLEALFANANNTWQTGQPYQVLLGGQKLFPD